MQRGFQDRNSPTTRKDSTVPSSYLCKNLKYPFILSPFLLSIRVRVLSPAHSPVYLSLFTDSKSPSSSLACSVYHANPHHLSPFLSHNLLPIIPPLRAKTNYINLGSFLIKPVQRVMRYPLLLMELLSATPESHHDRPLLAQALLSIKEINVNINEYKRRKDLGMSKSLHTLVPF